MPTTTIRPNANGDVIELSVEPAGSTNYQNVDEETPDDATTNNYVSCTAALDKRDLYGLEDINLPAGSTIEKIVVYARTWRASSPAMDFYIRIKTGGTEYESSAIASNNAWTTFSNEWTTNPNTGNPWTQTEINALQAGVRLTKPSSASCRSHRVTQVYGEVVYKTPYTKTYSIDILLKKLDITKTYTSDILVKKSDITKTYTADVILGQAYQTHTKQYTADTLLKKLGITKTYSSDVLLKKSDLTKTYSADLLLKKPDIVKTYPADVLLLKSVPKTYPVDVLLKKVDITKTYTADVIIGKVWTGIIKSDLSMLERGMSFELKEFGMIMESKEMGMKFKLIGG